MVRPDFLPVTLRLISRYRERRSFRASFDAGMCTPRAKVPGAWAGTVSNCPCCCRSSLVVLPGNSPVFIRARRLHDELFARKVVYARQVFADKGSHQCALDVIGELVSGF